MDYQLLLDGHRSHWVEHRDRNLSLHVQGALAFDGAFLISLQPLLETFEQTNLVDLGWIDPMVDRFDGVAGVIVVTKKHLVIISDRVNSHPLYCHQGSKLVISDSCELIARSCGLDVQNKDAVTEYLLGGFVSGEDMLLEGIRQCLAGSVYCFDLDTGALSRRGYFDYYPDLTGPMPVKETGKLSNELRSVLSASFHRLRRYVTANGFVPVVPLSGGLDSRLIAIVLKEAGLDNVICCTFGTYGHEEVTRSRAVAQGLGFTWLFHPYTTAEWHGFFESTAADEFLHFTSSYVARPHIVELLAA